MKKFWFGLTLIVSGSLFIMGALIGGGLVASGVNASGSVRWDIMDSDIASTFVFIGIIIFVIGFVLSLKEMMHEEK